MTLAYSTTARAHNHGAALHEGLWLQAKLVATGNVAATFTSVMSGQVDIGFSLRRSASRAPAGPDQDRGARQ